MHSLIRRSLLPLVLSTSFALPAVAGEPAVCQKVRLGVVNWTDVIATSAMKSSHGFTRLVPSIFTVLMYCVSFYALSQTLAVIPTGIAYAIWSGVGIVLISLVGWIVFQQTLDAPALIGMGLICAGVVVINVFSKATAH